MVCHSWSLCHGSSSKSVHPGCMPPPPTTVPRMALTMLLDREWEGVRARPRGCSFSGALAAGHGGTSLSGEAAATTVSPSVSEAAWLSCADSFKGGRCPADCFRWWTAVAEAPGCVARCCASLCFACPAEVDLCMRASTSCSHLWYFCDWSRNATTDVGSSSNMDRIVSSWPGGSQHLPLRETRQPAPPGCCPPPPPWWCCGDGLPLLMLPGRSWWGAVVGGEAPPSCSPPAPAACAMAERSSASTVELRLLSADSAEGCLPSSARLWLLITRPVPARSEEETCSRSSPAVVGTNKDGGSSAPASDTRRMALRAVSLTSTALLRGTAGSVPAAHVGRRMLKGEESVDEPGEGELGGVLTGALPSRLPAMSAWLSSRDRLPGLLASGEMRPLTEPLRSNQLRTCRSIHGLSSPLSPTSFSGDVRISGT
mmetsp:Transcript_30150/g.85131  ORF Transcript_30150/g.85131 Transcript_30150/m.85131 type:complete len:427 (+) Transcript_30150:1498-2778(+)